MKYIRKYKGSNGKTVYKYKNSIISGRRAGKKLIKNTYSGKSLLEKVKLGVKAKADRYKNLGKSTKKVLKGRRAGKKLIKKSSKGKK